SILKLAHPFAPFVTETIWQTLAWEEDSLLVSSLWPEIPNADSRSSDKFEEVKAIVTEIRYITKALGVRNSSLLYREDLFLRDNEELMSRLSGIKGVKETVDKQDGVKLTQTAHKAWLNIDKHTAKKYADELSGKLDAAEKTVGQLKARLANKAYIENAPTHIV